MKNFKTNSIFLALFISLFLAGTSLAVPPANDDCSNATAIGNVTNLAFDTSEATFDGSGHVISSPNIWYVYTAPNTGCATISLCGSGYDTLLAVYNGSTCYPVIGDLLNSDDDSCVGHQSELTIPVIAGNQYLIEIGGFFLEKGQGLLTITSTTTPCCPNDDCIDAEWIGNVNHLPFDITWATPDGSGVCMTGPNVWFVYTATTTGNVTVSTDGSDYYTSMAIYTGANCNPGIGRLIGCDNDPNPSQKAVEITFAANAGSNYLIEVGGGDIDNYDYGYGEISISTSGVSPCPPANDSYFNATPIGNVVNLPFDTTCATFDGGGDCMNGSNIWYCYTAPCTDDVTISLCGSSYDTILAVYNSCVNYPTPSRQIACNDDSCGNQSRITISATAGNQYLIEIGGNGSNKGAGVLNISCDSQPCVVPNDNCINATPVGNVTNLPFDTTCATFDGPGYYMNSPNIWYLYTATCTGQATVSLCGSSFDTYLKVYNGSECYPTFESLLGHNDDAYASCGGNQSELTVPVIAGNQYLIEVQGYHTATGQGLLTISCDGVSGSKTDLGDAPDSSNNIGFAMTAYPTAGTLANFPTVYIDSSILGPYGPKHDNASLVAYLGNAISGETEADMGFDEDSINNIIPLMNQSDGDKKDDGVVFPITMPDCKLTTFDYIVNVASPGTDLWVNVWCDWNRDGDWDDDTVTDPNLICAGRNVSEWAVQNQYLFDLPAGTSQITTPGFQSWHSKYLPEQLWMRITISDQPWKGGSNPGMIGNAGSGPAAGYSIGETEDYYFTPNTECDMCEDMNSDGQITIEDLSLLVNQWLTSCL